MEERLEKKLNLLWQKYLQCENNNLDLQVHITELSTELEHTRTRLRELEEASVQEKEAVYAEQHADPIS